jgi:hypothetical protein
VPSAITDSSRSSPIGYGLAMSNAGKNLCKRFETILHFLTWKRIFSHTIHKLLTGLNYLKPV